MGSRQFWSLATSGDEGDNQGCDVDPEHELGDRQITLNPEVLQPEIAFHPGEMTFDVGAWVHQVLPLADEE